MASTSTASDGGDSVPRRFSEAELVEMGVDYPPAPDIRCKYCGARVEPSAVLVLGRVVWFGGECGCPQEASAKRAEAEASAAEARQARRRRLRSAGILPRHQEAVIDDDDAALYLANFERDPGRGLYIQGVCGSGKTSLACALARELLDAGRTVLVTTAIDMLGDIQKTFDNATPTNDAIRRFVDCDFLVIDDMGKESAGDWAVRTIFQIINARYGEMRSTVITSEYDPPSLGRRMSRQGCGDPATAILSRLKETSRRIERPNIDFRSLPGGYAGHMRPVEPNRTEESNP